MRLIGLVTALNPATVVALSISGRGSSLDTREWPSFAQTYESLAELGVLNGTGCIVNGDEQPEQRRADTDRSCGNQQPQVEAALAQCAELAKRAEQDAKDGSPIFQQYFSTNDANTRNKVAQSFAKIAAGCGHDGNQPIRVECTPTEPCFLPQNDGELAAVADIRSGGPASIRLCRQAFNMPAGSRQRRQNQGQGQGCSNSLTNMGELLVHEMAHATVAAKDIAYGKQISKSLSTGQSLNNADNYALLAGDIAKNCGTGPGNGNRPPNNGNNGDNESPNGGNGRPPPGFPGNNNGPSSRPPNNRPPFNGPSNNGPPNDFPDFDNQFPNGNNFQPGGNNNNGPFNRPPTNGFPNNGPPNNFPDFDNKFNNNNFQPGGNNNDAGLDPSIISEIVGSNDFEVVPAGK
ncbi:Metallopeptidase, catalytic domain protein [Metarhizium guizhouense ARSEF 977]|uniref:Metallopeptidase, catalytic domain protein n=1 Tax=Metarhizium guizhouense (strain ARSEF 977) TaxID=1276136 RepID=A0A0B4GQY4_METGA|nr:Metallopeptidase, catalytic domain protein [Metarhizium guizhouense ARSEF 977]